MPVLYFDLSSKRIKRAAWIRPNKFLLALIDSIPSFITPAPTQESEAKTKTFFSEIYSGKTDETIIDGQEALYCVQILDVTSDQDFRNITVIDIGCGTGSFWRMLSSRAFSLIDYIGIDSAHPSCVLSNNARIINDSAYSWNCEFKEPVTICAINSFCYMHDLSRIPSLVNAPSGSTLLIVDPMPGIFWNRHFQGILLKYRSIKELDEELRPLGWRIEKGYIYALQKIHRVGIWPLNHSVRLLKT